MGSSRPNKRLLRPPPVSVDLPSFASALSGTRLLRGNGQRHCGFRGLAFFAYCPAGAETSKPGEVVAASSSKKVREYNRKAETVDNEGSDGQTCTDLGI